MVLAVQVTGYFATQEALGDGMVWIAAKVRRAALIDSDQNRAGIGAVESAGRVPDVFHYIDYRG